MYEESWPKTSRNPLDLLKTTIQNVRGSVKVGRDADRLGLIMAAGMMITIPALPFFVTVQRYLIRGWGAGAVKG